MIGPRANVCDRSTATIRCSIIHLQIYLTRMSIVIENKQEPNFLISIEIEIQSSYISACDLRSTIETIDALVFRVNVLDILVVVPIFAIDVSIT